MFQEIYPPKISEISDYTDGACTADQICEMEAILLTKISWKCSPTTAIHWLAIFLKLMHDHALRPRQSTLNQKPPPKRRCLNLTEETYDTSEYSSIDAQDGSQTDTVSLDSIDSMFDMANSCDELEERHFYPDKPVRLPKLLRDEFIRLARVNTKTNE